MRTKRARTLQLERCCADYEDAGPRVQNYIRTRVLNAALGLEEETSDEDLLAEALEPT